jgi:hypothetical protein
MGFPGKVANGDHMREMGVIKCWFRLWKLKESSPAGEALIH